VQLGGEGGRNRTNRAARTRKTEESQKTKLGTPSKGRIKTEKDEMKQDQGREAHKERGTFKKTGFSPAIRGGGRT